VKIVVAGGTGFIGSAQCSSLVRDGHEVVILSRGTPSPAYPRHMPWDGKSLGAWADEVASADAVVNLAGASIAARAWTAQRKRTLYSSRMEPTSALVRAIERADPRPPLLISASAVGYYGDTGDETVAENHPPGTDFLAGLVVEWEAAAQNAAELGTRVVLIRQGIVLGPGGGALPALALPFRLFMGGTIGSGKQWVSWVHIDDVVGLYRFAIDRPDVVGPINATAPVPVTNRELAAALGRALGRPSWLPVPAAPVRVVLGGLGDAILTGQRVIPAAAQRLGYAFREPELGRALRRALGSAA